MAEKKSWRDYSKYHSKDTGTVETSGSGKTNSWKDYSKHYSSGNESNGTTSSGNSSRSWRDYSQFDSAATVGEKIVNRVNNWLNDHNTYISNYQTRYADRKFTYEDSYVSDSADWLDTVKEQKSRFYAEAESILSYMDKYKDYFDEDWMKSIREKLVGAVEAQSQIVSAATQDNQWWSGFGSEELVQQYGSAEEAYKYHQRGDGYSKKYTGMTYDDIRKAFETLGEGEEREWLRLNQGNIVGDTIRGNADFQEYADKGADLSYLDFGTETKHGGTSRRMRSTTSIDKYRAAAMALYEHYGNEKDQGYKPQYDEQIDIYRGMTDDEFANLAYCIAKDKENGTNLAEQYVDSIEERLNVKRGTDIGNSIKDIPVVADLYGIVAGVDQFATGLENLVYDKDYYVTSPTQAASGVIRESMENDGFKLPEWMGGASIRQGLYDFTTTTANMAPSILASYAANALLPGSGVVVGNALMGASAKGNAYAEAINRGFGKDEASLYSTAIGASEVILGSALGGISKLGGVSSKLAKAVSGIDNGLARFALQYGGKIASEGIEEGLQEVLNPIFQNAILHADEDINWSEVAYSALLGGLSAGFLEGRSTYTDVKKETALNKKALKQYGDKTDILIQEGLESDVKSDSYKLATKYQRKTEKGKALSGAQIRNLLAANQEQITPKDIKKIQQAAEKRLTDLGQTEDVAKVAELATKRATGQKLTKAEKTFLANSQYGARVANELLPDNILSGDFSTEWAEGIGTKQVNKLAYNIKSIVEQMAKMEGPATYKSLEERVGTDEKLSVSKSGQATIRSTGEAIDLSKVEVADFITDKETGKITDMTLKADGKEVKASEIDYADDNQSYLFAAVKNIENITPGDATAFIRDYDPSSGQTVGEYLNGIDEAFTYGYHKYSEADMGAGLFTPKLSSEQAKGAYLLGQTARNKSDTNKSEAIKRMRTAVEAEAEKANAEGKTAPKSKKMTITYNEGGGKISDFDKAGIALSEKQGAGVEVAKILHKLGLGTNFEFFASKESENLTDKKGNPARVFINDAGVEEAAPAGVYRKSDGTIRIDLNAYNGRELTLNALAHELTHFIQQWSDTKYQVLADFLVKTYEKTDMTMHQRVLSEQARLKDIRGEDVSYNEAYDEVVAKAMMKMFNDGKLVEKLTELKAQDKDLAQKLWEGFKKILAKFLKVYNSDDVLYKDSDDLVGMKDAFEQLQNLFAEALVEASENFQASLIAKEAGLDIMPVEDGVQYSYSSLAEAAGFTAVENDDGTRSFTRDGKSVSKVTINDIENSPIGAFINFSLEMGDISKADADRQKKMFADICTMACKTNDFAMTMQFVGSAVFTGMKANADKQYGTTYDFPSICTKTQAVIDAMSAKMVSLGRGLNTKEIVQLYDDVFASGNPVPCPECYVFSRWIGIGGLLDNIKKYQDYYGDMDVKDVAAAYLEMKEKVSKFAEEQGISFGKAKGALTAKLTKEFNKLTEKIEKAQNQGEKVKAADKQRLAELEPMMNTVKSMTWLENVYFADSSLKKVNPNFRVPDSVLFDLNNGEAFATQYKEAWAFRTTQGAGYGKAITPYAEARLGEGVLVTNNTTNTIKGRAQGSLDNYFLQQMGKLDKKSRDALKRARMKQKIQAFIGGQRFQSTSDARYENASDYLLAALEMQAMGGMVQVYTKVDGAVPAFSAWGFSINQSLMPLNGGLDANGNVKDTPVGGMKPSVAFENRKKHESAGTITIGVNDNHIRAMFKQQVRDFIIPYHASGGKADTIAEFRRIQEGKEAKVEAVRSTDYSRTQSDKVLSDEVLRWQGKTDAQIQRIHEIRDARIAILTGGKPNMTVVRSNRFLSALYDKLNGGEWDGVQLAKSKVESQIFPNEFWDQTVTYDQSAKITKDYLEYCDDLGFLHRFSGMIPSNGKLVPANGYNQNGERVQLTDLAYKYDENGNKTAEVEEFFWKVLTDRRMYDNNGNYLAQKVVTLNDTTTDTVTGFAKNNQGREYDKSKAEALAKKIVGEQYSSQETDLDSDGNRLSAEQMEFFKDSVVRDAEGKLLVVYHGTPNGSTTIFDKSKTSKINDMGQGIYFSTNKGDASSYMGKSRNKKLYSTYVNIKAPFVVSDNVKISVSEAASLLKLCDDRMLALDVYKGDVLRNAKDGYITTSQLANTNISQRMTEMLEKSGKYDGIIDETVSAKFGLEEGTKHIIALDSNQIKLIDNQNPTTNPDIRYSSQETDADNAGIDTSRKVNYHNENVNSQEVKGNEKRKESREAFYRRAHEKKYTVRERGQIACGYTSVANKTRSAGQTERNLKKLGIKAIVHEGLEANVNGITRVILGDATSVAGDAVYVRNSMKTDPMETAGHEAFHFWKHSDARIAYKETVAENIVFSSDAFIQFQKEIADAYFGEEIGLEDDGADKLTEEIFAYITGLIHAGDGKDIVGPFLRDYDAVKTAWDDLLKKQSTGSLFSSQETDADRAYFNEAATNFVSHMQDIVNTKKGWYAKDVFKYVEEHPEVGFIELIYAKDKDVKKLLENFLNGVNDVDALEKLSWYMGEAYGDKDRTWNPYDGATYPYRGAVRTFRNAIKKRINAIMTEQVGGTNLGIKNGEVTLDEVKELFGRLNSNEEIGLFAEKVFAAAEKLGVNIRFVNKTLHKGNVAGDQLGDMVEYKTSYFNDTTFTDQRKASTILHELIHACTVYVISANPSAGDVFYGSSKSENYERIANAATRLNRIYMEIQNDPDFKGQYGIKNAKEMVAELANEEFVGLMKKKNLWDKIVDWICELFGIRRGTSAYDNARLCLDYILDNPEVSEYKAHAIEQRSNARYNGYDVFGQTLYSSQETDLDVGYHAGDLGKSESLRQQGLGRDTGHFGTGTYFVGNKASIEGYNSRNGKPAPVETVDFNKYNLFKPKNAHDGFVLHDFLRGVDGYWNRDADAVNTMEEYESLQEKLSELAYDIESEEFGETDPNKESWMAVEKKFLSDAKRMMGDYKVGKALTDTLNRLTDGNYQYDARSGEYYSYDFDTDQFTSYTEDEIIRMLNAEEGGWKAYEGIEKLADDYYSYSRTSRYESWSESIKDVAKVLGISEQQVRNVFRSVTEDIKSSGYTDVDMETADSAATRFMKALGYEGIDVRGIKELDNTSYGSVIYELKGEDLARKNAIGTARYSTQETDNISNRDLLANAFEWVVQNSEEYKLIQEYKGHIKLLNEYEQKLSKLNAEIRKITFGTEGERDSKKLKELQTEAKKVAENINRHDKKLLSLEASEPLRKVIERERKKEAKKTKDHVKELLHNKKARAEQTELRHKIRKAIRDLDKILNRGNKKMNVKEDMKSFVSKALELADYLFTDHISNDELIRRGITVRMTAKEAALVKETEDILNKLYDQADSLTDEEFTRLDAKRKSNLDKLRDLLTAQRNERLNTPVYNLFNDLVTEYASLKNSSQDAVKAAYNEELENSLRAFISEDDRVKILKNMRVADMTTEELNWLYRAYTMVLTNVRNANKFHVNGMNQTIEQVVGQIAGDFSSRKIPDKKLAIAMQKLVNKLGWDYEKLYYALDRIGSEAFTKLIMNIADSENTVMQDVIEAAAFRDEMVEKYGFNNWDVNKEMDREFLDNTGKKFKLTLGQLMALYAYSRREGAWDHIEYGGFVFGEAALTNPRPADSYKLSKDQCEAITNLLTKEQKAYAEDMQKYLSEVMGEKGNEVSMLLYGIKMFGEKNYFPIHIAGQFKAQANESQAKAAAGFSSMSNAGFTHAQNPNAKAPFVLEGFNEIWTDHVNEMSRYHGTVPALEDLRRVMNRSTYSDAVSESQSIKQLMENSYGKEAVDYFDNLYREANSGAITDKLQKPLHKLLSLFRKNSVAYSLSVLIQQPASLVRAYDLIDRKYFGFKGFGTITSGVAKAVSDKWTKSHTNAYNEMLKYAPGVTMAKEIGGFDTAIGGSIRSYLLDTNKSLKQKWKTGTTMEKGKAVLDLVDDNAIANLPNMADKIAWIEIWNACKRETVATHKDLVPNSDEFMKAVGERFTEVIRATQVYDSIFAKSPMLKSKNLAVQMLVSFMNEPNTVANMAEKAVRDATRGNWKQGARTAAVVVHSIIFTNVLKSIIYAMRDDDEDETYIEKYIESVVGGMMDDLWALNYIPLVRDAWSLAQGYDVERADMAIVADAVDALGKVIKNATTATDDMTEEQLIEFDKKVTEANWKLVESVASFFGIPVKNIRREIEGVLDHARIASANAGQTTAQSVWDKVYDAVVESIPFMQNKNTKQDKLYDAIMSGDKAYLARLKNTYKDESAYQSAVRKALRENDPRIKEAAQARYEGRTEDYKRIFREIQKEGKFTFDDIMSAINTELSKLTPDKVTSDYTASGYVEAIAMGNTSEAQAMKDDIIATKVANGKTQEEAEKEFVSNVSTGIRDAYTSGLLDEAGAEKMLMEYADKDEEEAASKVSYWTFCEEHQEYKDVFTEAHVEKYHEFAEPADISVDVYAQFINGTKGLSDIKDKWGDVEVTKREQVLEVIDSLPLSRQQKDALYLAAGYSESKIWDVPW